jgi:hypothetical protein
LILQDKLYFSYFIDEKNFERINLIKIKKQSCNFLFCCVINPFKKKLPLFFFLSKHHFLYIPVSELERGLFKNNEKERKCLVSQKIL